jgi:hypothetical protein
MQRDREIVYKRLLRKKIALALREYSCDRCQELIFPGAFYELEIRAIHVRFRKNNKLWKYIDTRRTHESFCSPPHEEDPCRERDQFEEFFDQEQDFPLAA